MTPAGLWQLPSKLPWPPALLDFGRRCLQKTASDIHHCSGQVSLSAETTRFEGQGQENVLGQEVVVLCQQCNPWDGDFTNTRNSQEAK